MRYSILFLTLLIVGCTGSEKEESLPNIVFIFADDLGYGDLGCFGATDIKTPNIDRLATDGIRFTDFYSASHVCSPSRAGLLTGRYPQRMGINGVFFPESFTGMSPEEITIAELLKTKGYATGIVGKWHLGHLERFLPLQQGFDEYFGIPYSNDMESVVYMDGNDVIDFNVDQRYTTRTYTEKAVDFIDRHKHEPFYLYVAHSMPHVPIYASEDFLGTSDRGLYGDVIQELDGSVGEILQALEEAGLMENTLVVFSSDNGPWLVMEDHGGSAGPLREGKQFTFDGGMRVPTIAMWKGTVPPGQVYSNLATQMDWFPTFANLAQIPLPDDRAIDGEDITNVLLGIGQRQGDEYLFFDLAKLDGIRAGDLKLKLPYPGFSGAPWKSAVPAHDTLLIDLRNDIGESNNLYAQRKEDVWSLIRKMEQRHQDMGDLPPSLIIRTPQDNSHYEYLQLKRESM